jgi:hypothetical protein
MTSKPFRHDDGTPGITYYEIGKAGMNCPGFMIAIESKWEMEKADDGSFVACQFVCHEKINIAPDGDVFRGVPYPRIATLDSWLTAVEQAKILDESMEHAEMRANEKERDL